jgi:hypothetical protein
MNFGGRFGERECAVRVRDLGHAQPADRCDTEPPVADRLRRADRHPGPRLHVTGGDDHHRCRRDRELRRTPRDHAEDRPQEPLHAQRRGAASRETAGFETYNGNAERLIYQARFITRSPVADAADRRPPDPAAVGTRGIEWKATRAVSERDEPENRSLIYFKTPTQNTFRSRRRIRVRSGSASSTTRALVPGLDWNAADRAGAARRVAVQVRRHVPGAGPHASTRSSSAHGRAPIPSAPDPRAATGTRVLRRDPRQRARAAT